VSTWPGRPDFLATSQRSEGRFTSPDDFLKDSHVGDPQSWNKYAYARNNPLVMLTATARTRRLPQLAPRGRAVRRRVKCRRAWRSMPNPEVGSLRAPLTAAAATMKGSIEGAWTGSFTQDGVTYNVSTTVTVSVAGSADAAINSGAQNVIGMTGGPVTLPDGRTAGAFVQPKSLWALLSGGPDQGKMDIGNVASYSKHEFAHLLGTNDKSGSVLSNTSPMMRPASALPQDYRWGLQEVTSGVNEWLHSPPQNMRYGVVLDRPRSFTGRTNVGAPFLWWK
jgi:hypothetical protein